MDESLKGILLIGTDESIERQASNRKLPVMVSHQARQVSPIPFEKTLIVHMGTRVPWDWLEAGFRFLDQWDAAVPLWQYTVTAESAGTKSDRERTRAAVGDLRVLLHAVELLFVRSNAAGRALVESWQEECDGDAEPRLAFLRALHAVKPKVCVLPTSWLTGNLERLRGYPPPRVHARETINGRPMVRVEISPGQFVKCFAGDEEKVQAMLRSR